MKSNRGNLRKQTGAGIAIITLMIGTVLISSLGLFTFEMLRHNTCFDELRSACESAALAGAAAMASSDDPNTANTRNQARLAAQGAFAQNSVVGNTLGGVDTASMTAANYNTFAPPNNGSAMFVEFLDPVTKAVIIDDNDPNGRVVRVSAAFTNEPPFGKFLGIPSVPMRTRADSSVPQLDVVMCFDTSGSIDDQTPVTLVARLQGAGKNTYTIKGQDTIYNLMAPPASGTGFGAYPPQALSSASNGWSFNTNVRGGPTLSDAAPATVAGPVGGKVFSDEVVNIDGNKVFAGMTISSGGVTYEFPDVGTLVEAARGNLENITVATNSLAAASLPAIVTPKPGYQAAYMNAALNQTQPISAARQAAIQFFQIMNNNTDAHFGFVSFSTAEHHQLADSTNDYKISGNYTSPGQNTVREPGIQLDKNNNRLTEVLTQCIPPTQAYGSTNFQDSLQQAVDQLKQSGGLSRSLSKKAVLFFTDGQPTVGGSWGTAAALAQSEGIQIYTVGLAQCSAIIPGECENLNAGRGIPVTYKDPNTGATNSYTPTGDGMAKAGAPGGKFFLVVDTAHLRYVFENIARSLVQLVKTQ
jgi:hypothetical protein